MQEVLAIVITLPILVVFTDVVGVWGGMIMAVFTLHQPGAFYGQPLSGRRRIRPSQNLSWEIERGCDPLASWTPRIPTRSMVHDNGGDSRLPNISVAGAE